MFFICSDSRIVVSFVPTTLFDGASDCRNTTLSDRFYLLHLDNDIGIGFSVRAHLSIFADSRSLANDREPTRQCELNHHHLGDEGFRSRHIRLEWGEKVKFTIREKYECGFVDLL